MNSQELRALQEAYHQIYQLDEESPYTVKNLGTSQYSAFKKGGGDAAIRQGYSAGEVVARGRKTSQYTKKNLGEPQYGDFKSGGGDAAIRQGYSAGEVVARGRNAASGGSGSGKSATPAPSISKSQTPKQEFPSIDAKHAVSMGGGGRYVPGSQQKPIPQTPKQEFPSIDAKHAVSMGGGGRYVPGSQQKPISDFNRSAYSAGGGNAQMQKTGKSISQIVAQGKKNLGRMDQGAGRSTLTQSFDLFDIVLGHLIGEGYADNEGAALQIMANMSEGWMESIVEARVDDDLSDEEKSNVRNTRSGIPLSDTFTRTALHKKRRRKPPVKPESVKPTKDTQADAKYRMAVNQPEHPAGKRVRANWTQDTAERGPSGNRGS